MMTWPTVKTCDFMALCPWPWLKAKAHCDKWHQIVAAGHVLRYWPQAASPAALRRATAVYCQGKTPRPWRLIRQAFSRFTASDFAAVREYLECVLFLLQEELFELQETYDPSDVIWRATYIAWCEKMDDAAAVMHLLRFFGACEVLPLYEALYEHAAIFCATVPVGLDTDNPQLLCALAYNPEYPWVSPVEDPAWYAI